MAQSNNLLFLKEKTSALLEETTAHNRSVMTEFVLKKMFTAVDYLHCNKLTEEKTHGIWAQCLHAFDLLTQGKKMAVW